MLMLLQDTNANANDNILLFTALFSWNLILAYEEILLDLSIARFLQTTWYCMLSKYSYDYD